LLRKALIAFGSSAGVGLLIFALWAWANSDPLVLRWGPADASLAAMSLRCAAVATAAVGEGLLVLLVVGNLWRRDGVTKWFALSAALVFLLSAAGAVALGLAGR
jgi:hypothetical protein